MSLLAEKQSLPILGSSFANTPIPRVLVCDDEKMEGNMVSMT